VLRTPERYRGGVKARDGGQFIVGEDLWWRNPRHAVPRAYRHVAQLWHQTRSGMGGFAALPEPGGVNQQPAWLVAAFGVLAAAEHDFSAEDRRAGGA
jgi:hypothetical protein